MAVTGRLQIRKNTKNDRTYINPEVIAGEVRFLDWAKNKEQSQNTGYNSYDNDMQAEEDMEIDVPF